jgi:tripartite-type tricarboxylate transporter receptor subunit TctC
MNVPPTVAQMVNMRTCSWWTIAATMCAALSSPSFGADAGGYPNRPIHIIISYPAGTATDTLARVVGARLEAALGQPVVIDIKTGGAGNVGLAAAARAAPDGYTLTIGGAAMCINANVYGDRAVDPVRDFAAVAKLATTPVIVVSSPTTHIDTIADLVARARREPGKLAYSTPGVGTPTHIAAELLALRADVSLLHVPYAGSGQLMTDVLSGEVPLSFALPGAVQQFLASRQLKAIAVTSARRIAALPDVPTVAEAGYPGFEVTSWHSILAPAGTPREIVVRLNQELVRIVQMPEVRERLAAIGMEPAGSTPEQLAAEIRAEVARWGPVLKRAGIRPE